MWSVCSSIATRAREYPDTLWQLRQGLFINWQLVVNRPTLGWRQGGSTEGSVPLAGGESAKFVEDRERDSQYQSRRSFARHSNPQRESAGPRLSKPKRRSMHPRNQSSLHLQYERPPRSPALSWQYTRR